MKHILILTLLNYFCVLTYGQADTTIVKADSGGKKNSLTIGVSYALNADYYGQKSSEPMPYVAVAAVYKLSSGFYVSGMAYRLLNDSSTIASAYNAGIGYEFFVSKKMTGDISYSYTWYPELSPFLQAANPHNVAFSLAHQSWLKTSVEVEGAFGKTNDIFVTPSIAREINLFSFSEKDIVTLSPRVHVTAGTQRFYSYYLEQKNLRDSVLGILLPPVTGQPSNPNTSVKTETTFDLLSWNLKLPLAYNRKNLLVECAYQLSLLGNKAASNPGKINSFFNASFYYQF